ncbi:hypothetical protein FRC11_006849 [Ceratobasidium sp. 423]|nr:hypothetical protein FRC11_006849 [Ceratobasidium sp. 423]
MVHGDIKGPNVLVSDTGMVKVADFGVSIVEHQEIEFSSTTQTFFDSKRVIQAPEILGEDSDSSKKGDVYAVGMTMTEIYTGEPPYGPENLSFRQIDNIIKGELRPSRPNGLPANTVGNSIWELMNDCWMGSPEQRPTAAEVYERAHGL